MSKTEATRYSHYVACAAKIQAFRSDLKEYEMAAATGLTEDQVYYAVKMAVKRGWMVKQSNGAYMCTLNKTYRLEAFAV